MRRVATTLAAGATSLALLALNFFPRRGVIVTDEGPWPESWRLEYGWPSTAYTEFGYDPAIRMLYWTPEGLALNALIASAAVAVAFLLALAFTARRRSS